MKAFENAKTRLKAVLTAPQRAALARFMAIDVLQTLSQVSEIDRILLVGQTNEHAALAAEYSCSYSPDDPNLDVSDNVTRAARLPLAANVTTLLVLPADLPLLTVTDIRSLISRDEGGVTICRSGRDGGTNALMASPPTNVVFSFGSNSAQRHALAAQSRGQRVKIVDDEAFQWDIDVPDDLVRLCRYGKAGQTIAYLRSSNLTGRFAKLPVDGTAP